MQCYKTMSQHDLWLDCSEKLTAMIQNIIEFAKLIPGFMRLSQDDQVIDNVYPPLVATHLFVYALIFLQPRFCC